MDEQLNVNELNPSDAKTKEEYDAIMKQIRENSSKGITIKEYEERYDELIARLDEARRIRYNNAIRLVNAHGNIVQKNYANMVERMKGNPNEWFRQAFDSSKLVNIVRDFENTLESDKLIDENYQDENDYVNPESESIDESSKAWEDKVWASFDKAVAADLKLYFNTLYKLASPCEVGSKKYDYDTNNEVGVPMTMGANFVISNLLNYGNYNSVNDFLDSIERMSRQIPELYGFVAIADRANEDPVFANYLFSQLANPKIVKTMVVLKENGIEFTQSNKASEQVGYLIYSMMNTTRSTMTDLFTDSDIAKLTYIHDMTKRMTNDSFTRIYKNEKYQNELKREKQEIENAIYDVLKKYCPKLNITALQGYMYSDPQHVADNINILLGNLINFLYNVGYTVEEYNRAVATQRDEYAKWQKSKRLAEETGLIYSQPAPVRDFSSVRFERLYSNIINIAKLLVNYQAVKNELNSVNAEGNLSSDVINNSYITNMMKQIAYGNAKDADAGLNKLLQEITKGEQYRYTPLFWGVKDSSGSYVSEGLFKRDGFGRATVNPDARKIIQASLFNGVKDADNAKAVMYDRMSKGDYFLTNLYAYFHPVAMGEQIGEGSLKLSYNYAGYFMRTPSDAPKNFIIQAPRLEASRIIKPVASSVAQYAATVKNRIGESVIDKTGDRFQEEYEDYVLGDGKIKKNQVKSAEEIYDIIKGDADVVSYANMYSIANDDGTVTVPFVYNAKDYVDIVWVRGKRVEGENSAPMIYDLQIEDITSSSGVKNMSDSFYAEIAGIVRQEGIANGQIQVVVNRDEPIFYAIRQNLLNEINTFADQLNNLFVKDRRTGEWNLRTDTTGLIDRAHYNNGTLVQDGKLTGNFFQFKKLFATRGVNVQELLEKKLSLYGKSKNRLFHIDGNNGTLNLQNRLVREEDGRLVLNITKKLEQAIDDVTEAWIDGFNKEVVERTRQYRELLRGRYGMEDVFGCMLNTANAEMSFDDLFEGDVKFYKDAQDFLKRAKEAQAGGKAYAGFDINDDLSQPIKDVLDKNGNVQPVKFGDIALADFTNAYSPVEGTPFVNPASANARNGFRAVTIYNTVRPSKYANRIREEVFGILKKKMSEEQAAKIAQQIYKGFADTTKTNDAQSYITIEEFIRRRHADGTLNQYDDLLAQLYALRRGEISAKDMDLSKINARIQVQKNFYFDHHFDVATRTYYPRQIKNAEFVLVPELLEGTDLAKLYDVMIRHDIGQVNTAETSKAAKKNILTFWDNDGNVNANFEQDVVADGEAAIEDYYYRFLYKQQDVAQHMVDEENKAGVQIMKKMVDNADESVAPHIKKYFDNYCANIKADFNKLIFNLGWKINKDGSLGNIEGSSEFLDFTDFYSRARHEAQRLGLDENFIDYITPDELGNPVMPNYMNNVSSKLESIAQAIFNANITRQTLPGWHAAQVTQIGHGMKVLDDAGKLRELKYHPAIIKGQDKRLTTKINNDEYEQTDEFRELYETSKEANRNGEYWKGIKGAIKDGTVGRLATVFRAQLDTAGSSAGYADGSLNGGNRADTEYTIRKNVSGKLFHDIFEVARNYLPNGELVDIHDSYDDCVCYLSEDGTSGFAIEQATGNLVSVFNLGVRKGFLFSIKDYIRKEGATHLDAYASDKQNLREIYRKTLGAKVVSSMDYNMEYDHDDIAKNHGKPEVVFMAFGDDIDGMDVEERHFGQDEYEAAAAYAQSFNEMQAAYAEVMIPRWSARLVGASIEEIEKEGLDIQIAYRIPTEGKQSVSIVKVVGFLDDVYGSTIMLPDEWVTQTGADFDVDSVYAVCYEMWKGKNGRVHKWTVKDAGSDLAKYKYYVREYLGGKISDGIEDKLHPDKYKEAKDRFNKLAQNLNTYKDDKEKTRLIYADINNLARQFGLLTFNDFKALPELDKLPRKVRNNNILDAMIAIMGSENSREENYSRSNFDDVTAAMKEMDAARGAGSLSRSAYNPLDQIDFMENAMSGASLKAFSVTRDTFNSLNNYAKSELGKGHEIVVEYDLTDGNYDYDAIANAYGVYGPDNKEGNAIPLDKDGKLAKGKEDAVKFRVRHNQLAHSLNNRNVVGKLITVYSSETTAHILDAIKEGAVFNENQYTFGTFKTLIDVGIDYRTAVAFLMQPSVTTVNEVNNETNSIYIAGGGNAIRTAIKRIAAGAGFSVKGKPISDYTGYDDVLAALDNDPRFQQAVRELFGANVGNGKSIADVSITLDAAKLKRRLEQAEITGNPELPSDGKAIRDAAFDIAMCLVFNKIRNTTQNMEKIMRCSNPDRFGAKQTIRATRMIKNNVREFGFNESNPVGNTIKVGDKNLLQALYPNFEQEGGIRVEDSCYPFLAAFFKYATEPSIAINSLLFPTENQAYSAITNAVQQKMGIVFNDEQYREYKQYMMSQVYANVPYINTPLTLTEEGWIDIDDAAVERESANDKRYWDSEIARIFGYEETQSMDIGIKDVYKYDHDEIEAFARLTPAQKALWVQVNFPDGRGIFDYVNVNKYNQWEVKNKGYTQQTIRFNDTCDDMQDVYRAFNESFYNRSPFVRLAALDLIKYAFVVDGFKFKKGGLSKVVTNNSLYKNVEDMGTDIVPMIRRVFQYFACPQEAVTQDFMDRFVRSHSEMVKTVNLPMRKTTNGIPNVAAKFDFYGQGGSLVYIPFDENAKELLACIGIESQGSPRNYVRISKPLPKGRKKTTLYKIRHVDAGMYLIPLNLLERNETGRFSVNANNNQYADIGYYDELIDNAVAQNVAPKELTRDGSELHDVYADKHKESLIPRFKFVAIREVVESKNEFQRILAHGSDRQKGEVGKFVSDVADYFNSPVEDRGSYVLVRSDSKFIGSQIPKGVAVVQNIPVGDNMVAVRITRAKQPKYITRSIMQKIKVKASEVPVAERAAYDNAYAAHAMFSTYYKVEPVTHEDAREEVEKAEKEKDEGIKHDMAAITSDVTDFYVEEGDKFAVVDQTSKMMMNALKRAEQQGDSNAAKARRALEIQGINEYSSRDIVDNRKNIYSVMAQYTELYANVIDKAIHEYELDGERYNLGQKELYEALREHPEEVEPIVKLLLEAVTFGETFGNVMSLPFDSLDAETAASVKRIRNAILRIRNNAVVKEGFKQMFNNYLANEYSTNPNVRLGIVNLNETFGDSGFWESWIGDIHHVTNKEIQVIVKLVDGIMRQAVMEDAPKRKQGFLDRIDKVLDKQGSFSWDNVIDKDGRLIRPYAARFIEDRNKLREAVKAARDAYGEDSIEYVEAKLARDEWLAENVHQIVDQSYYRAKNDNIRAILKVAPDLYVEYMKLVHELYGDNRPSGALTKEERDRRKAINKKIAMLTSEYKDDYTLKSQEERDKAAALKNFIDAKNKIESTYFEWNEAHGFRETLERNLNVVSKYERSHAGQTLDKRLEDESYREAYEWIQDNSHYVLDADAAKQINQAFEILKDKDNPTSVTIRKILEEADAYDEFGNVDPRKLSDEQVAKIKELVKSKYDFSFDSNAGEAILVKDIPAGLPVLSDEFYRMLRDDSENEQGVNRRRLQIIGRINALLGKCVSRDGRIHAKDVFEKLTEEERGQLADAYMMLKNIKGNRKPKELRERFKQNVKFMTNDAAFFEEYAWAKENLHGTKDFDAFVAIFVQTDKAGEIQLDEKGNFVPNNDIYGYIVPLDDKYVNKEKTEARKLIEENVEFVPTEYYYAALREATDNGNFKEWYEKNHAFNPYKHKFEPLRVWTTMKVNPNGSLKGRYVYVPTFENQEKSVKEEWVDPNYKTRGANYNSETGQYNNNLSGLSAKEREVQEILEEEMRFLEKFNPNNVFVAEGFVPRKRKLVPDAKWYAKQALGIMGLEYRNDSDDKWHDKIDYANDRDVDNDMLHPIKGKGYRQLEEVRERGIGETPEEYDEYLKAVRERNEEIKAKNREIDNALRDDDWRTIFAEAIEQQVVNNARAKSKNWLYLLQEELRQNEAYGISALTGNLKRERSKSTDTYDSFVKVPQNNNIDIVTDFIRRVIYDQFKKRTKLNKYADLARNITSAKYMILNVTGGIANVGTGFANMMMEAFAGESFSKKDLKDAVGMYMSNAIPMLRDMFKDTSDNFAVALAKYFDIVDFDAMTERVVGETAGEYARRIRNLLYGLQSGGEHFMQNTVLFAVLKGSRIFDDVDGTKRCGTFQNYIWKVEYDTLVSVIGEDADLMDDLREFKRQIRMDKQEALKYDTFKRNLVEEFLRAHCSQEQIKEYIARRKQAVKQAKEEWAKKDTAIEQLELGKDGRIHTKRAAK